MTSSYYSDSVSSYQIFLKLGADTFATTFRDDIFNQMAGMQKMSLLSFHVIFFVDREPSL